MGFVCRLLWSHAVMLEMEEGFVLCFLTVWSPCHVNPDLVLKNWLELQQKTQMQNSPGRTDTERHFLPALFMLYARDSTNHLEEFGAPQIPSDSVGNEHSQDSQKLSWEEDSIFAVSPSFQSGFLHPPGDCSVTGTAS